LLDAEANAQAVAFGSDYFKNAVDRFMKREPACFQWPSRVETSAAAHLIGSRSTP
jgi:hypothetical protein